MTSSSPAIDRLIAEGTTTPLLPRAFDGVICFGGEDWWYHNRGHYDMQMMRRLSAAMPVLYVNSIGMRMPKPSEGMMFLRRVGRKLKSIRRGAVAVAENFTVFSPFALPGGGGSTRGRLVRSVRTAARRAGITRPLIWVVCPTAADVADALDPAAVLYQRTDRYESFPGIDARRIIELDRRLKAAADVTVFCSSFLHEREARQCRRACLVDHGVDFARFAAAGARSATPLPKDIASLPRPRVGFVGGIDAHTFDPGLFLDVARRVPAAHFVLVGSCSLPNDWCTVDNVSLLGRRPYEQVASYMAACDVLIMPWRRSDWIEACNPIKLKEYLATGRPVVSTDFPELRSYEGLVRSARDAGEFAEAIIAALRGPHDPRPGRARVRAERWSAKARSVLDELAACGCVPQAERDSGSPDAAPRGDRHRRWPDGEDRIFSRRRPTTPASTDLAINQSKPPRTTAAMTSSPENRS
ncbi:MAG: glycosyltransferase [Planctomycetota bacterium]|nr:glycosyltransferase [Planctomycetota bacterium]